MYKCCEFNPTNMVVLRFTNCARKRVVVVCTQSQLVMFQGRVFFVDSGDGADMGALESLRPSDLPKTHVVVLINGEWEHWDVHMHLFHMLDEEKSKHFLLRLRWHLHSNIRKAVMKIQRWWKFIHICRSFSLSLRRKASIVVSLAAVSCCSSTAACVQPRPRQQLQSCLRLPPKRQ